MTFGDLVDKYYVTGHWLLPQHRVTITFVDLSIETAA